MGRLKKSVAASRANGAMRSKKLTKKRVPVMARVFDSTSAEQSLDSLSYTIEYRPRPPKGYFYEDDLDATARCISKRKRVHFEEPSSLPKDKAAACRLPGQVEDEAIDKAATMLKTLSNDPVLKARKLQSLAKSAGIEFTP